MHGRISLRILPCPACLAVQFHFRNLQLKQACLVCRWSHTVLETFSLLAVGTSLIGTLLGASQFFIEQMTNSVASSPTQQHVWLCSSASLKKQKLMKWSQCYSYNRSVQYLV